VWLGANDAADPGSADPLAAAQGVPLERYRANLVAVGRGVRTRLGPATPLVVVGPPPVCDVGYRAARGDGGAAGPPSRSDARTARYEAAAREAAEALSAEGSGGAPRVVFVGLREAFGAGPAGGSGAEARAGAPDPSLFDDGLHLSPAGQATAAEAVWAAVAPLVAARRGRGGGGGAREPPGWRELAEAKVRAGTGPDDDG